MPPLDYDRKCFIFYNKIYRQTPWKIPSFATTKKNGRVSNQGFGVDIFIKISKGMFVDNKNRKRNTLFKFFYIDQAFETSVYRKTTFSSGEFNKFRRQVRESLLISCDDPS